MVNFINVTECIRCQLHLRVLPSFQLDNVVEILQRVGKQMLPKKEYFQFGTRPEGWFKEYFQQHWIKEQSPKRVCYRKPRDYGKILSALLMDTN